MRRLWLKFWYFIFDRLYVLEALRTWKGRYERDPLPHIGPTSPLPAIPATPAERNTGEINEAAIEIALRARGGTHGSLSDVDVDSLGTGELALWYWDKHRDHPMGEETRRFRTTSQQMRAVRSPQEPHIG